MAAKTTSGLKKTSNQHSTGVGNKARGAKRGVASARGKAGSPKMDVGELKELVDTTVNSIQKIDSMVGIEPGSLTLLQSVQTALNAADAIGALNQLKKSDSRFKKISTGLDAGEAVMSVVVSTVESKLDLAGKFVGNNLELALRVEKGKAVLHKFLGRPLAAVSIVSGILNLLDAIRTGNERKYINGGSKVLSGGGMLVFGASAGSVFGGLVAWYAQGLNIMGELGGILKGLERQRKIREVEQLYAETYEMAKHARYYLAHMDRIMKRSLNNPEDYILPFNDADLNDSAMNIGYRMARVVRGIDRIMKNSVFTGIFLIAKTQTTPDMVKKVSSDMRWSLTFVRKIEATRNVSYPCIDDLFLVRRGLAAAVAVIVARLQALSAFESDAQADELKMRINRELRF
ncbi:MAG: hypothetical protein NXH95_17880 [Pseudomonadaceae bacterium]|nr:hypothetical protein [Pseudomonadaceae bacterium]